MDWISLALVIASVIVIGVVAREFRRRPERRRKNVSLILMMICVLYQNLLAVFGIPFSILLSVPAWLMMLGAVVLFLSPRPAS